MKKIFTLIGIIACIAIIGLAFFGCKEEDSQEQPKFQTELITGLFPEPSISFAGYSATIEGNFTNTNWQGIGTKVKSALNTTYETTSLPNKNTIGLAFKNNDVVIVLVKNPVGYTNYKTSAAEPKKMYINVDKLDTVNFVAAATALGTDATD